MIESKALARVAVRIICLVSPLRLNAGASTPCQDSMKLHGPKWEHPPRRALTRAPWWSRLVFMGHSAADTHILLFRWWAFKQQVLSPDISMPVDDKTFPETRSHRITYCIVSHFGYQDTASESEAAFSNVNQRWLTKGNILPVSISCPLTEACVFAGGWRRVFNIRNDDIASRR